MPFQSQASSQRIVKRHVLALRHYLEIFWSIIQMIAVDVVNHFAPVKFSAERLFGNEAMLVSVAVLRHHLPVQVLASTMADAASPFRCSMFRSLSFGPWIADIRMVGACT